MLVSLFSLEWFKGRWNSRPSAALIGAAVAFGGGKFDLDSLDKND